MTEDEREEGWGVIGEKVRTTVDTMRRDASHQMQRAQEIDNAWSDHDWEGLSDLGVLGPFDLNLIQKLKATYIPPDVVAGKGEVVLSVHARWASVKPDPKTWSYHEVVPRNLSSELCIRVAMGLLFTEDFENLMSLEIMVERDGETIREWG
jgi:hypothetical protein